MTTDSVHENQPGWMNLTRLIIAALVILILAGGTWVRMRQLAADPLDVSHSEQLFFLLTARSFSPETTQIAAGLPTAADYISATRDVPLLQWVDAGLSRMFALDLIEAARIMSVLGWMLSSLLLYLMLRRFTSPIAALAVLAMIVFMPFSIQFSRVVLPGCLGVVLWAPVFVDVMALDERAPLVSGSLMRRIWDGSCLTGRRDAIHSFGRVHRCLVYPEENPAGRKDASNGLRSLLCCSCQG